MSGKTETTQNPENLKITRAEGKAVAVRGDDIDTDRIIPARFLRCVTFEGLGDHAFEDERKEVREKGGQHPLDDPRHRGATILVVNRNFGCGSSREHAPQSLLGRGIRAILGESFAEIFFGNCQNLGLPCLTVPAEGVEALMGFAETRPEDNVAVDVASGLITAGEHRIMGHIPPGPRNAFLRGTWSSTGLLLDRYHEVEALAERLPYLRGF